MKDIVKLLIKQQRDGFDDLTHENLMDLKKYYSESIKYKQGLDRLPIILDLEKINELLLTNNK